MLVVLIAVEALIASLIVKHDLNQFKNESRQRKNRRRLRFAMTQNL
jgi:hypothetical protein